MDIFSNPNRRETLGIMAAGAASSIIGANKLWAASSGDGGTPSASRPNLILFFVDECRADALSSYGNPVCKTPNFDLLAAQGTRFSDCHVQFPVCGASRCSLLTGLPTADTGHRSLYYFLRRNEPNMFRYLKDGGYDTYWFGKNDALAPESYPLSLTEWKDLGYSALPSGGLRIDPSAANTMLLHGKMDRREFNDYKLLQLAIKVLERREKDKPFCIFLPLTQPHPPYFAPEGFDTMYNPVNLPPLAPPGLAKKPLFHDMMRQAYHLDKATDADFRQVRATYYGQVSYADWLLGQLMEALERTGHTKDTMLVAASDHGDYAGDYGLIEKWPGGLETCLTHVPLIARMPGGAAGHVVGEMVELFDIMATFLDVGGIEAKHTHFARSLVPQLMGASGDAKRAAFTESGYDTFEPQAFEPLKTGPANIYTAKAALQNEHPQTVTRAASIATPDYKLIARPGGQSELYDRRKDPLETINLIQDRGAAKVREALQLRLMNRYITVTGVPPLDRDARDTPTYDPPSQVAKSEPNATLNQ